MKILHLSKFYPPDPGGLEQVVAQLAEQISSETPEVYVTSAA